MQQITVRIPNDRLDRLRTDARIAEMRLAEYLRWILVKEHRPEHFTCDVCGTIVAKHKSDADFFCIQTVIADFLLREGDYSQRKCDCQGYKFQGEAIQSGIPHMYYPCSAKCKRIKCKELEQLYVKRRIAWQQPKQKTKSKKTCRTGRPNKKLGRPPKATSQSAVLLQQARAALRTNNQNALVLLEQEFARAATLPG